MYVAAQTEVHIYVYLCNYQNRGICGNLLNVAIIFAVKGIVDPSSNFEQS